MLRSGPHEPAPLRDFWDHTPRELHTVWTLMKRGKVARLVLLAHQLGWELRIDAGYFLMRQVCRSDRDIEDVAAAWKNAMIEKGWQ